MTARELPSMRFICQCVRTWDYRITKHATQQRLARHITVTALENALLSGEIIERYPDDEPYPSCLVLGWLKTGDPLHIVCSRSPLAPRLRIVTVYEPSDEYWESDYKTRKR